MASSVSIPEASVAGAGGPASAQQTDQPLQTQAAKSESQQPVGVYFAGQAAQYANAAPESGSADAGTFGPPEAGWKDGKQQPEETAALAGPQEPRVLPAGGEQHELHAALSFSEASIRRAFIRKVFGILSAQLLLTATLVLSFVYVPPLNALARESLVFWLVSFIGSWVAIVALVVVLSCCTRVSRSFPANMLCLAALTLAMGFMLGITCSFLQTQVVAWAMVATVLVVVGLALFTLQSKIDFTIKSALVFVTVFSSCFCGIWILIPFFRSTTPWFHILFGLMGIILFSGYFVIDICLMVGGKYSYAISPEEYIFASLQLYLDVVNIFLYMILIFGGGR